MMKCFKCGGVCEDGINFCPHCGAQLYFSEELISQAQQNDQQAISRLYEMTYNSVYNTIRVMVSDEDTVYDLLQDTYLKAFGHLDQLGSPQAFKGWLRRIARNLTVDYLRKKKPMLFSSMTAEDSGEEIDFPDERVAVMPEDVMDRQETKRLLDEIMNSLPEDQRAVITLYYYEEIPVKEIAAMLSVSENTVKSRLSYGRKKIELGVKELEKKGTKLYSLAPIPFLLFLLRSMDAQAAEIPNPYILQNVLLVENRAPTQNPEVNHVNGDSSPAAKASGKTPQPKGSVIKAGMKGGAAITKKAIATKIIAAVATVAVGGGCIAGGVYFVHNRNINEETQTTQYEADSSPTSELPEISTNTEEPAPETDVSETEAPADAAPEDFFGYYGDVNGLIFQIYEWEGELSCTIYYQGGSEGGSYASYEISGNTLTAVVEYNNKTHKFILQSDGSIEADIGVEEALPAGIYPRIPDDAELPPWTTAG